jgi:outer membrane protein assembly factor BamB/adenine/guanine phosphoribosyltransferase-like PRPP-binding protein
MKMNKKIELLREIIEKEVYISARDEDIVFRPTGGMRDNGWLFDFRRILMNPESLTLIGEIFWERYEDEYPFQLGSIEVAGIPLVVGIATRMHESGAKDISSFFIRKSRKKDGLMRMIEGGVVEKRPIILVDDIINSGKSFIRQVEVLEELGHKVDTVWSILRFRDLDQYKYFHDKGIKVESLFCLDDLTNFTGVKNLEKFKPKKTKIPYKIIWKFASENPNYFYVVTKSDPTLDEENVYFGSDSGVFWALNQKDGSVKWKKKVGFHPPGKGIFSSPILHKSVVYFGAYDGNLYALDSKTGKSKWIFMEADWIGSSPAISEELGLIFVGLEFGLLKKRGAVVAIDLETGKKKWQFDMPMFTHSSPLYIPSKKQIIIGSNDGNAYLFDAKSGKLIWQFETGKYTDEELRRGFSENDIKESFAYDKNRDLIVFGNIDGNIFILDRKTGREIFTHKADFGFYSTPLIYDNKAYISSLDKHLYCINLDKLELKWKWFAGARIFSSPVEIEGSIYMGANTGRLTELNPETGKEISFITVPERITNKVVYNPETKRFFLPTFANEIYCLEKQGE